jgi:hypothetical protein
LGRVTIRQVPPFVHNPRHERHYTVWGARWLCRPLPGTFKPGRLLIRVHEGCAPPCGSSPHAPVAPHRNTTHWAS